MIRLKQGPKNRIIFIQINNLTSIVRKAIRHALYEIGRENVVHTRALMSERKTGKIYKIAEGVTHQASAPGEAPAILSGKLFENVDYAVRGSKQMEFGDKTQLGKPPYGLFLELGTKNIKIRPHINRTVKEKYKDSYNSFIRFTKMGLKI